MRFSWAARLAALAVAVAVAVVGVGAAAARGESEGAVEPTPELVLEKAYFIEGEGRFQPSGLALYDGAVYTVSDKHGLRVWRLDFEGEVARAVPAISAGEPVEVPERVYDFDVEGVEFRDDKVYIASEETSRIYCVDLAKPGAPAVPVTPDLAESGRRAGLFQVPNAGIEAFAILEDGTFLIAAERQPRGLIAVDPRSKPATVRVQIMETTRYRRRPDTALDFAGLSVWRGRVFALARNQGLVVELLRDGNGGWREGAAWSFHAAEEREDLRYRDRRYGMAEGLAIDDARIYVVFDNNDDPREVVPDDHRPQLMVFANPMTAGQAAAADGAGGRAPERVGR